MVRRPSGTPRLDISTPYDPVRLTHVRVSAQGALLGLPKEWDTLLSEQNIVTGSRSSFVRVGRGVFFWYQPGKDPMETAYAILDEEFLYAVRHEGPLRLWVFRVELRHITAISHWEEGNEVSLSTSSWKYLCRFENRDSAAWYDEMYWRTWAARLQIQRLIIEPKTRHPCQYMITSIYEFVSKPDYSSKLRIKHIKELVTKGAWEMDQRNLVLRLVGSWRCRHELNALGFQILPQARHATCLASDDEGLFSTLREVLAENENKTTIYNLQSDDAEQFLDLILTALKDSHTRDQLFLRQSLGILIKLSALSDRLPSAIFVSTIRLESNQPICGGGFADIFRGFLSPHNWKTVNSSAVALKRLRVYGPPKARQQLEKKFCQEALIWKHLDHEHILPFLGIDRVTFPPLLCMVSPWMKNGNVLKYLEEHPSPRANIDELLLEVTKGLEYMHALQIVHGDLRGTNIFIDDDGHVRLADFGLIGFADATTQSQSGHRSGSVRWMAPELHSPELFADIHKFQRTAASDIYAFGCVCLEIYTGLPPFFDYPHDSAALLQIMIGNRPVRPLATQVYKPMSDVLWDFVERCWAQQPLSRPNVVECT
ncbi:hypothetical protein JAAARDRAFT_182151 [Jaapia argillacea MUCL 33604]|uniref:Protein kinase domain-containing protein n=1 Tax=Jaapia argillacea MUCL 33604 TaxID=933084 RepID=A0A067PTQ4_9AGAM|nr:hypothetical protein JAAARDRAFT_182151 [Jaapia argillacea MUCL 33604]